MHAPLFQGATISQSLPCPRLPGAILSLGIWLTAITLFAATAEPLVLKPVVEIEEDLYTFAPANNGAGPMWCGGSTCLVRIGDDTFASGLETLADAKPLNNCRWTLFKRDRHGWTLRQADPSGRTREPCPLAGYPDGRLFLSANPTLAKAESGGGPARPEILEFQAANPKAPWKTLLPVWDGEPRFTEHSYRSFAADASSRELILFQNIDYTHAEWAFLDAEGRWSAKGQLRWPQGVDYPKPEPIRICYPNVALKNRAAHFCGVSDIIEPYPEWRAYKKELTGRDWDYDFRRLFYTWTPDITRAPFADWVEIASRDKTCGWISPGDLWVGPDGLVHIVWSERAIDERLRARFFPEAKQSHSIRYARVREGKVILRRALLEAEEGKPGEIPSAPRFQVTSEHRLLLVYHAGGRNREGKAVSENRVLEILASGDTTDPARIPLAKPFTSYFTATVRGGSPPSDTLEFLGHRAEGSQTISYARVRLRP
jgi:hypothetical protein